MKAPLPPRHLSEPHAAELVGYLLLFCFCALVVWVWGRVGAPWEVKAAGYIAACFGLVGLAFLCAAHDIRLFRAMRTQWRRTFPRHRR
jgi:hypothetical protein